MIEIIQNRGSGKTKQLLEEARKHPGSFIVTQDKRAFEVKAHSYGYDDILIRDYEDLKYDNFPLGVPAYIHNGDKMLYWLLNKYYGIEILGFTATSGKEQQQPKKKNNNQKKNKDNTSINNKKK